MNEKICSKKIFDTHLIFKTYMKIRRNAKKKKRRRKWHSCRMQNINFNCRWIIVEQNFEAYAKTSTICVSETILTRFFVAFIFRVGSMKSLQRRLTGSRNPPLPPYDLIRVRIMRAARIRRFHIVKARLHRCYFDFRRDLKLLTLGNDPCYLAGRY